MTIYISGIVRHRLLIAIVGHHIVVALVTYGHILDIQIVVTLHANFAICKLLRPQIIDILSPIYQRWGFWHLYVSIKMLRMFSCWLGLVFVRNNELIIMPDLIIVRVFEHLFIIRSIWSLRNLLFFYLIILNFNSMRHLTLISWIKICSLFVCCLISHLDRSKLLVARIVLLINRWLEVTWEFLLFMCRMQGRALPLWIKLQYFNLELRLHKYLCVHVPSHGLTEIYRLTAGLHQSTIVRFASISQQLPDLQLLLLLISIFNDFSF